MTVREILAEGIGFLKSPCFSACVDTPALDAALLLAETLGIRREALILRGDEPARGRTKEDFFRLLERRRSGECVAYILGRREFRGLEFSVDARVLVPRPDTETLVEAALECVKSFGAERKNKKLSLLDLCTGSGALAISLKNECPFLSVSASDVSGDALEVAALNARRLLAGVSPDGGISGGDSAGEAPVVFVRSDLFENITGRFNLIVSNPPYVPAAVLPSLPPEVRKEPPLALDGGADGLELIVKIISRSPEHLFPGGVLLLEADPAQMDAIRSLLEESRFTGIEVYRDLAGRERVIKGAAAL